MNVNKTPTMDRTTSGSRLVSLFSMLVKFVPARNQSSLPPDDDWSSTSSVSPTSPVHGCYSADEVLQLRFLSSKVLQYVTSQDKEHRDVILNNAEYIGCLLRILEVSCDQVTSLNLIYVFAELVLRIGNSLQHLSVFVSHGATQVFLQILAKSETKSDYWSLELIVIIHQLLAKLGQRDKNFAAKARLSQAVGVSLDLVRNYINNPKVLQPVINVLKLYAADAANASYLGSNGLLAHLFKIFVLCQQKHLILLKNAIDTLCALVKSKSNASRTVSFGGLSTLLTMYSDWSKIDAKNRHIALRKAILVAIKNLTDIRAGRLALMETEGIRLLYSACVDGVDCRELEGVIFQASIIMRKCFPKTKLPVMTLHSPLTFPFPDDDAFGVTLSPNDDDNEYESSVENDDDVSSDDDIENQRIVDSDDDVDISMMDDTSYKRTWEDLTMYKEFFPELYEFDPILQDADPTYRPSTGPAVVIQSSCNRSMYCQVIPPPQPPPNGPLTRGCQSFVGVPNVDRLPVVTTTAATSAGQNGVIPSPARRLSLGAVKVGQNQKLAAGPGCSSMLLADAGPINNKLFNSSLTADSASDSSSPKTDRHQMQLAPPSTSNVGRSPKVRRKANGKPTKSKEKKKAPPVSSSKQTKGKPPPTAEDWPKFDFTSVISALTSAGYNGEQVSSAFGNSDIRVDEASGDEDCGPVAGIASAALSPDAGVYSTEKVEDPELYARLAQETKSVGRFNKLAYPDLYGHNVTPFKEAFYEKKFGTQRNRILQDIDRFINPDQVINRVVYDLDDTIAAFGQTNFTSENSCHGNSDEQRVRSKEVTSDSLEFNSQFESGNLRKAIQVRRYEYDLILNPDINLNRNHQWFYFEVSNMEAGIPYRFNIVNCEKVNSQFNFGMRPVMFSVAEALQGRPFWYRVGSKICYYKNHFVRSTQTTGGVRGKSYFTATFTITFKQERDVCYLAYHYPYTYTMLQYHLYNLETEYDGGSIYFRNQSLCETVAGNSVPVLTITSHPNTYDKDGVEQLKNRPYIFLTSRVHPGESNASWVMKGTLELLMSDKPVARMLRDMFIFKIVPMLNPDGVINGNHRCSLVGEDLNRRWFRPCPKRHPTIYHTKGLMQYIQLATGKSPLVFCDYHGHSRRKNVFLYGCSPCQSWMADDSDNPTLICKGIEDPSYKLLPKLLHQTAPSFSLNSCRYTVEKVKETTARVVVWRQLAVMRSYTMESSYCGCDQGQYKGQHINTLHLEEMGCKFAEALAKVRSRPFHMVVGGNNMLPVLPSGDVDDEYVCLDSNGYLTDLLPVPIDSGSSSLASGVSDRDDAASDVIDNDIDSEMPYDGKFS